MQMLPELRMYLSFCEKIQEKIRSGNADFEAMEKEMEINPPLIFSEVIDCDAELIV